MRRQARPVSGGSHFQLWQIAGVSGATQRATRLDSAAIITRVHLPPLSSPYPSALLALFIEIYFFVAFYLLIFKSKVLKCAT